MPRLVKLVRCIPGGRDQVARYIIENLLVVGEKERHALAKILSTAGCRGTGYWAGFKGYFEWLRDKWMYEGEKEGEDPLVVLESVAFSNCGCSNTRLLLAEIAESPGLFALALIAGVILGFILRALLG